MNAKNEQREKKLVAERKESKLFKSSANEKKK